ncbi:MAG: sugar phosphate isomerase/epimerase [Candidatus Solibacter sp.]
MITGRRDFGRIALAGLASLAPAQARNWKYKGVRLGVGTYSFRGLPLEEVVRIVREAEIGGIELESAHVEPAAPPATRREAIRQWRTSVPLGEITAVRKKLESAGATVYAYNAALDDSAGEQEIGRVVEITKALGAGILNTSTTLATAKRAAPLAARHGVRLGLHPSGNASDPNSIGSGASYLKAFEFGPNVGANPDLYQYKNWGPDPIAFLKQIHGRVTTIHCHDRKAAPPAWAPFGEGDMPVRELLLLARREKFAFPFSIERIYTVPNLDQVKEMRRSLDWCRSVLG